jgi:phage major head subunit gpT-like protein
VIELFSRKAPRCAQSSEVIEFTSASEVQLSLGQLPAFTLWSGSDPFETFKLVRLAVYVPVFRSRVIAGAKLSGR